MKKLLIALVFISNLALADSSGHPWVRVFADKTYEWNKSHFQVFPASAFSHFNWQKGAKHTCALDSLPGEPECPIIETSPRSEKALSIFNALASSELNGIPHIEQSKLPIKIKLKKVFSKNIRSCLQAGTLTESDMNPSLCCTGFINPQTKRCQLKDYVDVSVYTNLNVSSEASRLTKSLFDTNGYIKDTHIAAMYACHRQMCASNTIAYGILISRLHIPGQEDQFDSTINRFMEGNVRNDDAHGLLTMFNSGLKLNTHAYCIPRDFVDTNDDLIIYRCEQ
jgi:hypothetical protein